MCCKVFVFICKNDNSKLYLNGSDSSKCTSDIILQKYIEWYNKDFAPFENLPQRSISDFKFLESFYPINFYDETCEETTALCDVYDKMTGDRLIKILSEYYKERPFSFYLKEIVYDK